MKQIRAAIDCGTNAFSLIIAEIHDDGKIKELHRDSDYVYLAENGFAHIGEAPMNRAVEVMKRFRDALQKYEVQHTVAFGTMALRNAGNTPELITKVKETSNLEIQVISGEQEARFIYEGVKRAVPIGNERSLIMDIGGGSVEFIVATDEKVEFAKSVDIGITRLNERFKRSDPILPREVIQINDHVGEKLGDLLDHLEIYPVKNVIGASTFDLYDKLFPSQSHQETWKSFAIEEFEANYNRVIFTSLNERLQMPSIPKERARFYPEVMILIRFALTVAKPKTFITSRYALKHGALFGS